MLKDSLDVFNMKYGCIIYFLFFSGWNLQSQVLSESFLSQSPHRKIFQQFKIHPATPQDSVLKILTLAAGNLKQDTDPLSKAELNQTIGELYLNKSIYDQALKYLTIAKTICDLHQPEAPELTVLCNLGKAFFHRGNYLLAGQNFRDAMRLIKSSDDQLENEIRDYMSMIYNLNPSINLSVQFFIQSLELKKKLGDTLGMLRIAQRLTETYYQENQLDKSLQFAQMAIDIAQQMNKRDEVVFSSIEKANLYIRLSKPADAWEILARLKPQINVSDSHINSRYETTLGNYYLSQGVDSLAQIHYNSALPNRITPALSQYVYRNQAESFKQNGNYKQALEIYQKYLKELSATNTLNLQSGLINIEETAARRKSKDEIKYLNAENIFKDSLLKKEKLLADALSAKNEIQSQQLHDQRRLSTLMESEVELQKQQVRNEKSKRLLFIGASMVFLLLGGLLYIMYRQQKNKNRIIEKQSGDMEILMKEIHHRVKNNLQIISSLLDLQALSIQDETASSAIKEGKNRVQSMALIHQNLYRDGNIRSINVKEYIQHLVTSLFDSYQIENNKIKLSTEISALNLDVDTVVPIGLIVNELISNSLKYAFVNQPDGDLSITLKQNGNDTLYFSVRDNGKGFPPGWSPDSKHSFGYQLIKAFAKKLKAKMETFNDHGAVVTLHIAKYKII